MLDGKKQAIFSQLSRIDEKLKTINQNSLEIEDRVYQLFREALFQLQHETQKKVTPASFFLMLCRWLSFLEKKSRYELLSTVKVVSCGVN